MGKRVVQVGDVFGRLTTIAPAEPYIEPNGRARPRWLCRCECGEERAINENALTRGATKSCGCLRVEATIKRSTKHGNAKRGSRSKTYKKWVSMINRCAGHDEHHRKYYGDVVVCDRWLHSFESFLEDMGECPDGLTLDRINPHGNYEPDNCRWVSWDVQRMNKRKHLSVT